MKQYFSHIGLTVFRKYAVLSVIALALIDVASIQAGASTGTKWSAVEQEYRFVLRVPANHQTDGKAVFFLDLKETAGLLACGPFTDSFLLYARNGDKNKRTI